MDDWSRELSIEQRLTELGITLPEVSAPIAAYVPVVRTGDLVFVSGQLPRSNGVMLHPGIVGKDVTAEEARSAARLSAINVLAALKAELGSLDSVDRIVRVNGFVASDPSFTGQPSVIDGASSLFLDVFGDAGRHTRVAVGVAVLPLNAPVEVDIIAQVR